MLTLNNVVKQLNNFADSHGQVKSFFYGELYDFAASGDIYYPAMAVVSEPNIYSGNTLTYNFNVYFMDRVHKDISNRVEVLSDMQLVCLDLLAYLSRTVELDFMVDRNITLNDFVDSFDGEVSGYWFNLAIKTKLPLDRCALPLNSTIDIQEPLT